MRKKENWSDEIKAQSFGLHAKTLYLPETNTAHHPAFTTPTLKDSGSIRLWRCFSLAGIRKNDSRCTKLAVEVGSIMYLLRKAKNKSMTNFQILVCKTFCETHNCHFIIIYFFLLKLKSQKYLHDDSFAFFKRFTATSVLGYIFFSVFQA